MSADNWRTCPECLKIAESTKSKLYQSVESQYGKIPSGDWLNLLEKSKERDILGHTLREDYEIYMDLNGKFYIKYLCRCDICKFIYEYNIIDETKYEELKDK
tara:strand:- start:718 stop:1023 length:306 start_codon:yes stop_codon:yes gene_type:complete